MGKIGKRVLIGVVVVIVAEAVASLLAIERASITVFERRWTSRLDLIAQPQDLAPLFERYGGGDVFEKMYSNGTWLVAVSTSSCGNGELPDLMLAKDSDGHIYKITDTHFCGRSGIAMAIPELNSESLEVARSAIIANAHCTRIK